MDTMGSRTWPLLHLKIEANWNQARNVTIYAVFLACSSKKNYSALFAAAYYAISHLSVEKIAKTVGMGFICDLK